MGIASLARVRTKLEIPQGDDSFDLALRDVILGVEEEASKLTALELTAQTRTETLLDLQIGRRFYLNRRPIASITSVKGRGLGSTQPPTWFDLSYDLQDAEKGLLVLIGGWPCGVSSWPPAQSPAAWLRGRAQTYPVVQVVYATALPAYEKDFIEAVEALCVYRYRRQLAAAASNYSVAGVSESLLDADVPDWVKAQLLLYTRPTLRWVA